MHIPTIMLPLQMYIPKFIQTFSVSYSFIDAPSINAYSYIHAYLILIHFNTNAYTNICVYYLTPILTFMHTDTYSM